MYFGPFFWGVVRHGKASLKRPWIWVSQTSKCQGTLQNAAFDHVPKVEGGRSPLNRTMSLPNLHNFLTFEKLKNGDKSNPVIAPPPKPPWPRKEFRIPSVGTPCPPAFQKTTRANTALNSKAHKRNLQSQGATFQINYAIMSKKHGSINPRNYSIVPNLESPEITTLDA